MVAIEGACQGRAQACRTSAARTEQEGTRAGEAEEAAEGAGGEGEGTEIVRRAILRQRTPPSIRIQPAYNLHLNLAGPASLGIA